MLREVNYEVKFLEEGFKLRFDIGYEGPEIRQSCSDNTLLKIGSKTLLWNKLMKEVKAKRVAGPFKGGPPI